MTTKTSTIGQQSMQPAGVRPYWKPEPKRLGFSWWALLLPAVVYTIGVITYAHNAFVPGLAAKNGHEWGSAFMVLGGEAATVAAAAEVFRKHRIKTGAKRKILWFSIEPSEANAMDWIGIIVSLVATLGNLFVVYVSLTDLSASWVGFVREYGALVLILCSGVDFYAGLMEFGFYNASFEERWTKWNDGLHDWEMREYNRMEAEKSKPAQATFDEKAERARIKQELADAQQKKVIDNLLKDDVTKAVYDAAIAQPDASNSQLAESTGYSRTTIANKLDVLRAVGAIK